MRLSFKTFLSVAFLIFQGWWILPPAPAGGQTITTLVGICAAPGYYGDGGPASLAGLDCPDDVAFDSQGNYYIADACSNTVRKVNITTDIITTYAGLYNPNGNPIAGDGGPATLALLDFPSALAFDPSNNLYIADFYNAVIRKVDAATGIITTFAGNGTPGYSGDGGPAASAEMANPNIVRFGPDGNLYVTDAGNSTLREVNMSTGVITTIAGTGAAGYSGDGGPATLAEMNQPEAFTFDTQGGVYIGDCLNAVYRKVAAGTGVINTVIGTGVAGYSGDGGPATLAQLNNDLGSVTFTCNGDLLLTDDFNNRVRMVDKTTGVIHTVIGTGLSGCSTSGTPLLTTNISHPEALAFDTQGDLYMVDYDYNLVQSVAGGLCPATATPTSTPTLTPTSTVTSTPTHSETPTPSFTTTNTPTITLTPTWTPTATPTHSPTNSQTSTPSSTPSATPTATLGLSMGKQVSEPQAKSGDILTYTLGVTLAGTTLNNVVVTDTLPANVAFISMGTPSAGSAVFYPNSSQISWTLPATLAPGIYSLSYKTQVDPFTPDGTDIVNGARLTFPGLANPFASSVTVQVTGQYTVTVAVYNEAGELVDQIRSLQLSQSVDSLNLQGHAITSLIGENDKTDIYSQGYLLGVWNGAGADGNPVSNGVYLIKVNSVDPYGVVNTVTQEVTVSRSLAKVSVNVYNEAGEVVKHLFGWVDDPMGAQMTNVALSGSALQPGAGAGQPSSVQIAIQTTGAAVTLSWDGTNDNGVYVSAGYYLLEAHWDDGQGETTDISKGILVTANGVRNDGTLVAQPNILRLSTGTTRTIFKYESAQGLTLRVRIYTLAGEEICDLQGASGSNQASWDATGYASGLYLAAVDLLNPNGGQMGQQILKVMVLR
ncbi:MAG TPA: hypothetical protein VK859_05770 [bacterium]|nr:hypothetical protein [bacterium]